MTAPFAHHPESHGFSPEHDLRLAPIEVPQPGEPRTLEQQQQQLNQAADALNRIVSAETETTRFDVGQGSAYANLMRLYGRGDLGRDIAQHANSHRGYAHAEIHDKHKTTEAEDELRNLLEKGNTGSIVELLDDISRKSDISHKANLKAHGSKAKGYADATHETTEAGRKVAEARSQWKDHGHREPTSKDMPHYFAPKEYHDKYRRLKADYARAEKTEQERVAEPAIEHAKRDKARRDLEDPLKAAAERVIISDAIRDRVTTLFGPEREVYKEHLEQLAELQGEVTNELRTWGFGMAPGDTDQDARITALFEKWSQGLKDMSPQDINRHTSLHDWVVLSTRHQQRRAMILPETSRERPLMTSDRGVYIDTPDGPRTLHDDGTISRLDGGNEIREWSDGSPYLEMLFQAPETIFTEKQLAGLTVAELTNLRNSTVHTWESDRDLQSEVDAAVICLAYRNRMDFHAEEATRSFNNAQEAITNLSERLTTAESERGSSIDRIAAEKEAKNPDGDKALIRNEAIALVESDIQRIRNEIVEARKREADELAEVHAARTALNEAEYLRAFFGVTRPEEAGMEEGSKATAEPHKGDIAIENGTLNGEKGDWTILPNGASIQYVRGAPKQYLPNGEPV